MNHYGALIEWSGSRVSLFTSHVLYLNYYSPGRSRPERLPVGTHQCDFRSKTRQRTIPGWLSGRIGLRDSTHNIGGLLAVCWRTPCQTKDATIQYIDEIPQTVWEAPSTACQGKGSEAASLLQTARGITHFAGSLIAQTSRHRGGY